MRGSFELILLEVNILKGIKISKRKVLSANAQSKYKEQIMVMDKDTRKVSLVGMGAFNNVEQGGQTNATLLFTRENKRNVGRC